jgi:glycosyltransferase involved in cell wall biosynthesis
MSASLGRAIGEDRAESCGDRPVRPAGGPEGLPRVAIAAANCSLRMGGEAAIPHHLFRLLRARGVEAYLVTHERVRRELEASFPSDLDRLHFVRDGVLQRLLSRVGGGMSNLVNRATLGAIGLMIVQVRQRRLLRRLVRELRIDVVHQPYPVSPAEPSMIVGVGAPVVIGPMNGGMDYPPGFKDRRGWPDRLAASLGRSCRNVANRLLPGKLRAAVLLVANPRTRRFLPGPRRGEVLGLVENGVDLDFWRPDETRGEPGGLPVRFVFVGRLVDWKGVDLLLEAWSTLREPWRYRLEVVGDGPERAKLEDLCGRLGLSPWVEFSGFQPPEGCARRLARSDALILPSLVECGGSVVLEAMATGLPVIATDWGGPADYLDETCGILVDAGTRAGFLAGLASAVERLGGDPELRRRMGAAGRLRVGPYSWEAKVERFLEIYRRASASGGRAVPGGPSRERPTLEGSRPPAAGGGG